MPTHKPVKQTAGQLREVATDLRQGAADLDIIAAAMEQLGFAELDFLHYDQVRRAREYVENYVSAAKKAIRAAREERGDYAGGNHSPKRKTKAAS